MGRADTILAIVVPAFRVKYLRGLLRSLVDQTCKSFSVYVFDDASSEDIIGACHDYMGELDIVYHRFQENLGGRDLAAQWNRCIELVGSDWVLMPGDDDVLDGNCVRELFNALDQLPSGFAAIRGTLVRIDSGGEAYETIRPEAFNSAFEGLKSRFGTNGRSTVIEYMFNRRKFIEAGGFVSFPCGWHSDHATWLKLAEYGGVSAWPNAIMKHRSSGGNISDSSRSELTSAKREATMQWIEWIAGNLGEFRIPPVEANFLLTAEINHWYRSYITFRPPHALLPYCRRVSLIRNTFTIIEYIRLVWIRISRGCLTRRS